MAKYIPRKDEKFINPFHFVSIEKEKLRRKAFDEIKNQKKLTGYIECELETLTPLFIPNTTNDDRFGFRDAGKEKIKSYDFFSYENLEYENQPTIHKPVIPGSSMRGTIRTVYEAVTNSCLSTTNLNKKLFKRSPIVFKKAGMLFKENGQWFIQPASVYDIEIENLPQNYAEGEPIVVTCRERQGKKQAKAFFKRVSEDPENEDLEENEQIGYIHISEKEEKKYEKVFVIQEDEDPMLVEEDVVKNLLENYRLYRDETINNKLKEGTHHGYDGDEFIDINPDKINDADGLLVFYKNVNGKIYLSPSPLGREVYYNTLQEILRDHVACKSKEKVCPACQLFGFVNESDALGGRVRFADAHLAVDVTSYSELFEEPFILKELASPKITSTEFYIKKPDANADFWNYDYWIKWRREQEGYKLKIKSTAETKKLFKPEINGRKFYWHHPGVQVENMRELTPTDRNVGIRPLKKGIRFTFKVYFDGITKEELDTLLWSLELGNNPDLAHKMGMGKPYGLGSVKISVSGVYQRKIEKKDGKLSYKLERIEKPDYNQVREKFSKIALSDLETIMKFNHDLKNIRYPYVIPDEGSHVWFMQARTEKGTGVSPVLHQLLDNPENPELYSYERKENN